jgi:hypothetical protein
MLRTTCRICRYAGQFIYELERDAEVNEVHSMTNWSRRLKGVITLGVIGGGVWAGVGVAIELLVAVLTGGTTSLSSMIVSAGLCGAFGAVSAAGFATVLTLTKQGKSLIELSTTEAGLVGCAIGAAFPFLQMIVGGPLVASGSALLWVVGVCSLLGAGMTSSMVMIAKRSDTGELGATSTHTLGSTGESCRS